MNMDSKVISVANTDFSSGSNILPINSTHFESQIKTSEEGVVSPSSSNVRVNTQATLSYSKPQKNNVTKKPVPQIYSTPQKSVEILKNTIPGEYKRPLAPMVKQADEEELTAAMLLLSPFAVEQLSETHDETKAAIDIPTQKIQMTDLKEGNIENGEHCITPPNLPVKKLSNVSWTATKLKTDSGIKNSLPKKEGRKKVNSSITKERKRFARRKSMKGVISMSRKIKKSLGKRRNKFQIKALKMAKSASKKNSICRNIAFKCDRKTSGSTTCGTSEELSASTNVASIEIVEKTNPDNLKKKTVISVETSSKHFDQENMGCSSANEPVAKKTAYISREKEQKEKIDSESYQSLQKSSICTKSFLGHGLNQYGLPKLKLVLDLDETLVHSRFEDYMDTGYLRQMELRQANVKACEDFQIMIGSERVQVNTRPGLIPFLEKVSKLYDLYIFTAATPDYASYVLNVLDPNRTIFKGRFYRRHCTVRSNGTYTKDLRNITRHIDAENVRKYNEIQRMHTNRCPHIKGDKQMSNFCNLNERFSGFSSAPISTGCAILLNDEACDYDSSDNEIPLYEESVDVAQDFDDLSRIILVDNSPVCFLMQPENGVPISSFYDDGNDQALFKLERLLRMLDSQEDVRPHLQNLFNLTTEHIYRAIGQ